VLRIRDVYPGSRFLAIPDPRSRIPDPKTATKERGKKISCHNFFCSHKFHKIENYLIFEMLKKKLWANFQRFIKFFTLKLSLISKKYEFGSGSGIRDPGSGKNLFRIPGSKMGLGSEIRGSKRHQVPDPDPQHWLTDYQWTYKKTCIGVSC
jgi:hypothetical protein